mgnify:CR=1 FL=1
MKVNYQLILDKKIEELKGTVPTLFTPQLLWSLQYLCVGIFV